MEKSQKQIIIITLSLIVIMSITTVFFTQKIYEAQKQLIINHKQNRVILLNAVISEYILSSIEDINNIVYDHKIHTKFLEVDKIIPELNGIPESVEVDQRQELKTALHIHREFESMGLFLPNGDVYLVEPFSSQLNLPQQNYSFRDWYIGAMSKDGIYVSEPYNTHYTDQKTIALSTSIQGSEGSVIGIFHTTIQLDFLTKLINSMNPITGTTWYFVDKNGKIAMANNSIGLNDVFFSELIPTLDNKGVFQEELSGDQYLLVYDTIEIGSKKWFLFLIQPTNQAFAPLIASENLTEILLIISSVIIFGFGTMVFWQNTKSIKAKKQLEESNEKLSLMLEKSYELDKAKDEFSTMITHELKTPLVPVTVYCKMLKENMMGNLNKEQTDAINIIEKNTKHLTQLISDIMDARKLNLKKLKFVLDDVSIDEFFDEIYSNYEPIINQKGHKLVITISNKHIKIKTDKNRLRQVFDNLISNSLKFMPEKKGLIQIDCKKENENIIFHVKDNGSGIPMDKHGKIFQNFYQADTSFTRNIGGTGLGLSISKGIVEGLGGKMWFESDGMAGTTFFVQLPIKTDD